MNGWQPIETAPKDLTGKPLLLWDGHDYLIGFWTESAGRYRFKGWTTGWETSGGYDVGYAEVTPTHWMPLPEPPQ